MLQKSLGEALPSWLLQRVRTGQSKSTSSYALQPHTWLDKGWCAIAHLGLCSEIMNRTPEFWGTCICICLSTEQNNSVCIAFYLPAGFWDLKAPIFFAVLKDALFLFFKWKLWVIQLCDSSLRYLKKTGEKLVWIPQLLQILEKKKN